MDFEDRHLQCTTCGADFVWTAGEQRFFADRALEHVPRRCPACKRRRASDRQVDADRDARVTFPVRCSNCGRETTVPFRPTEGRPVFCRSCFEQRRHEAAASRRPTA
jgi:CxxC-x17-CxxC domain-containing protein